MTWIDREIPASVGKHKITSKPTSDYNCIAWAATGATDEWWTHHAGYKWPAPRSALIDSLAAVFLGMGYSVCNNSTVESGYEKVVLYARNGLWTHAAKQLPNGKWTSKLGADEDIEHDTPGCLCGNSYGTIHCIMRKAVK